MVLVIPIFVGFLHAIGRVRSINSSGYRIPNKEPVPPSFDDSTQTNITTQIGSDVFLPCRVLDLGVHKVSWLRKRDQSILAVDDSVFVTDERFRAFYVDHTETWTLHIRGVTSDDAGIYECQLSTTPKLSRFIHVHVVVPKVEIVGGPEIYVKSASRIHLRCRVHNLVENPAIIEWFKDGSRILMDRQNRRSMTIVSDSSDQNTGVLDISHATPADSGHYMCLPLHLHPANATVHVVNGENLAAIYHPNRGPYYTMDVVLLACLALLSVAQASS